MTPPAAARPPQVPRTTHPQDRRQPTSVTRFGGDRRDREVPSPSARRPPGSLASKPTLLRPGSLRSAPESGSPGVFRLGTAVSSEPRPLPDLWDGTANRPFFPSSPPTAVAFGVPIGGGEPADFSVGDPGLRRGHGGEEGFLSKCGGQRRLLADSHTTKLSSKMQGSSRSQTRTSSPCRLSLPWRVLKCQLNSLVWMITRGKYASLSTMLADTTNCPGQGQVLASLQFVGCDRGLRTGDYGVREIRLRQGRGTGLPRHLRSSSGYIPTTGRGEAPV